MQDHDEFRIASFFSGVGMLDRGLHGALQAIGLKPRTVLYCECEPSAQEVLSARAEDRALNDAPIWPDIRTLPGDLLRGRIDGVVGGFPCQDLSVAGARAGLGEGTRSGLFFDLLRIATDSGARLIFLENVGGIVSAPTPVPEAEDDPPAPIGMVRDGWTDAGMDERALAVVTGALSDAGFDAAWLPLRASDIGAPHGRLRWFAVGWRRG